MTDEWVPPWMAEDAPPTFNVYTCYSGDGEALYIGCSLNMPRRVRQHRATKPWWHEVERIDVWPTNATEIWIAEDMERWKIKRDRPRYNVRHNDGTAEESF